ncbi:Membrane proteinase PrsW, cleaves anti-sigma factor RsiW, M82 family [Salinibacillus kushneri]|uniref:Protease PrsW n=1 Tax=Salinibacillus kushneri TaxID=237682 RepID=A0A1I0HZU0_9BACI|nr:glutamic-type intramembrane protease PrsW [Salinibacillus kushneri]SET89617.1 Membrane proteinase PrsW, cleaves anti-sigma factor RsiW, M82 family [Salinibacillus kushneri]
MVGIISASIAPGLALLVFFYLKDRFGSEPLSMVLKSFIYGALLVFPIMFIQYAFSAEEIGQNPFVQSFFTTGMLEEFFKWFIFLYVIYQHVHFDNPYDGIVYGVSISLGFASLENLLYLLANGIEYALSRAIFPVSSHALFGVIMGYYMGKNKFNPDKSYRMILVALFMPSILHGLYDFLLQTIQSNWVYVMIPFMVFLWAFAMRRVKLANYHTENSRVLLYENHKESI